MQRTAQTIKLNQLPCNLCLPERDERSDNISIKIRCPKQRLISQRDICIQIEYWLKYAVQLHPDKGCPNIALLNLQSIIIQAETKNTSRNSFCNAFKRKRGDMTEPPTSVNKFDQTGHHP